MSSGESAGVATWPADIGSSKYVRLTTFRRDGTPVPTPVWFVPEEGSLWVWTGEDAGKFKRLRHTSRVLVVACDIRGNPRGEEVEAVASLHRGQGGHDVERKVARRYGLLFRAARLVLRVRGEGKVPVGVEVRRAG